MNEPRYQLPPLTLGQLEKVAFALDSVAAGERPGVYAVDDQERIFIAQGGDEYNRAERWVAAEQLQSTDGVNS